MISAWPLPETLPAEEEAVVFVRDNRKAAGSTHHRDGFFRTFLLHPEYRSALAVPLNLKMFSGILVLNSVEEDWFQGPVYRYCEFFQTIAESVFS
jgi:hypothetical protein